MTKYLKFISLATTLVLIGLVALSVSAYTPPSSTPPVCPAENPACNPPINVGGATQEKEGGIITTLGNISTLMKFVNLSDGRENVPVKSKWGGAGDKFILRLGAEAGTSFPVSIGLAASHLWNSVPAGLFYAWYIDGIERARLTDDGLVLGPTKNALGIEGGQVTFADSNGANGFVIDSLQNKLRIYSAGIREMIIGLNGVFGSYTNLNVGQGDLYVNDQNNMVGVGTTNPTAKLDVQGTGRFYTSGTNASLYLTNTGSGGGNYRFIVGKTGDTLPGGFGIYDNTATAYRMAVNSAGNVGIGTTNPTAKLHVNGPAKIQANNFLEFGAGVAGKEINAGKIVYNGFLSNALDVVGAGTAAGSRLVKLWDNILVPNNISTTNLCTTAGSCETVENIINGGGGGTGDSLWEVIGTSNSIKNKNTGNVGIGTVSPTTKLDVAGGAKFSSDVTLTSGNLVVTGGKGVTAPVNNDWVGIAGGVGASAANGANIRLVGNAFSGYGLYGALILEAGNAVNNGSIYLNTGGQTRMRVLRDGKVGIGTTNPAAKLEVNGSLFTKGLVSNGSVAIVDGTEGEGKVLVSNAAGLASWKSPSEISGMGGLPSGTTGQTIRHNGTAWVGSSNLENNGSRVTITSSDAYPLYVKGSHSGTSLVLENTGTGGRAFRFVAGSDGSLTVKDQTAGANRLQIDGNGLLYAINGLKVGGSVSLPSSLGEVPRTAVVSGSTAYYPCQEADAGKLSKRNAVTIQDNDWYICKQDSDGIYKWMKIVTSSDVFGSGSGSGQPVYGEDYHNDSSSMDVPLGRNLALPIYLTSPQCADGFVATGGSIEIDGVSAVFGNTGAIMSYPRQDNKWQCKVGPNAFANYPFTIKCHVQCVRF